MITYETAPPKLSVYKEAQISVIEYKILFNYLNIQRAL